MMLVSVPFTPPAFNANAFHCPWCNAYANQEWAFPDIVFKGIVTKHGADDFAACRCVHCRRFSYWVDRKLVHPRATGTPLPNADLSTDVARDYQEARQIATESPRGSAALLRLAIQKLCRELGEPGKNINDDIAALVQRGLPPKVQQALDIVRVVGNNAVHPGQIDLRDDEQIVSKLFGLINLIADVMITQPKHVQALYDEVVPENMKTAISKRDQT
jgi:hypothetical protein